MYADIQTIPDRSLQNPNLNLQEINRLLQFLRDTDYKLSKPPVLEDPTYIALTFKDDYPSFSIFTMEHDTEVFYPPRPNPKAKKAPGEVFFTNGGQPITAASGTPTTVNCHALGSHRPHLIRYNFTGAHPMIGDRLAPPSGQSYLETLSTGPFVAVSVPDTTNFWVWVIFNPTVESAPPPSANTILGYATVSSSKCHSDATVTIHSPRYYDNTVIPAVTVAQNTYQMQFDAGEVVLINLIDFYGAGAAWHIVKKIDLPTEAYGHLGVNMCHNDLNVGIADEEYWTDCPVIGGITTAENSFALQGVSGDPVRMNRTRVGGVDTWIITQVLHRTATLLGDIQFVNCKLRSRTYSTSIMLCNSAPVNTDQLTLTTHDIPYTFFVDSRSTVDTVRDPATPNGPCLQKAATKQFCLFESAPANGADKTIATLVPKTFVKKVKKGTTCVTAQVRPAILADIQTVYVVCFDTPIEELQIAGVKCSGTYDSC